MLDKLANPAELGKVPVEETGGRLRLTDVADVKIDHQPLIGDAVVGDSDGLLLVVEKFPGANTLEVTKGVEEALDELRPGLSGMRTDTSVFRPATLIEDAIDNLTLALIIAGLLAGAGRRRLPLPVAHRARRARDDPGVAGGGGARARPARRDLQRDLVRGARGRARRRDRRRRRGRRERRAAPAPAREAAATAGRPTVVLEASHEMRSPLTYATLIALLAVVPIAVMEGRPGAFFEPLALSYALAVARRDAGRADRSRRR